VVSDQQTNGSDAQGGLKNDLSVGELRAVIMADENGERESQVTLAAKVPEGILDHGNATARVGFFCGLVVAEEDHLSVPVLVLFLIVNDHFDPPCHLAVNITDATSAKVLEQLSSQERIHLMLMDDKGGKALALGGNPASRDILPQLVAHAEEVAPGHMPDESFWKITGAIYSAFGGSTGLLSLFSNLLEEGQELPIYTFKPSEMEDHTEGAGSSGG
jgi:hypothetical protein